MSDVLGASEGSEGQEIEEFSLGEDAVDRLDSPVGLFEQEVIDSVEAGDFFGGENVGVFQLFEIFFVLGARVQPDVLVDFFVA